jgi:hypothetical protein
LLAWLGRLERFREGDAHDLALARFHRRCVDLAVVASIVARVAFRSVAAHVAPADWEAAIQIEKRSHSSQWTTGLRRLVSPPHSAAACAPPVHPMQPVELIPPTMYRLSESISIARRRSVRAASPTGELDKRERAARCAAGAARRARPRHPQGLWRRCLRTRDARLSQGPPERREERTAAR